MAYARDHDLIALTNWNKPSVVQIRAVNTSPEAIGAAVIKALVLTADELLSGAVLTVEPARSRLRVLPFSATG